jgi:FMN phosphatase YigB (HAD superfamily)
MIPLTKKPKCIIFDIDNTLVYPNTQSYYDKFGIVIYGYIQDVLGLGQTDLDKLVKYYKSLNKYLEYALIDRELLLIAFKELEISPFSINWDKYSIAYKELYSLSMLNCPNNFFKPDHRINSFVSDLRGDGYVVVALSNCPEGLSRQILELCDFNPDIDFDHYRPWLHNTFAPPKIHYEEKIFVELAKGFGFENCEVLSVGDSFVCDILTATKAGMQTCHISHQKVSESITIPHVLDLKDLLI